jgi:hypothetical protein
MKNTVSSEVMPCCLVERYRLPGAISIRQYCSTDTYLHDGLYSLYSSPRYENKRTDSRACFAIIFCISAPDTGFYWLI